MQAEFRCPTASQVCKGRGDGEGWQETARGKEGATGRKGPHGRRGFAGDGTEGGAKGTGTYNLHCRATDRVDGGGWQGGRGGRGLLSFPRFFFLSVCSSISTCFGGFGS